MPCTRALHASLLDCCIFATSAIILAVNILLFAIRLVIFDQKLLLWHSGLVGIEEESIVLSLEEKKNLNNMFIVNSIIMQL